MPLPARIRCGWRSTGLTPQGKTTLADELAVALRGRGRDVIRASIEGFLRPRIERYRQGPESSRGCYEGLRSTSSDFWSSCSVRSESPAAGSTARRIYDRQTDLLVHSEQVEARAEAILLFDGVFLLRPELADAWDFRVFLTVASQEVIRRGRIRDAELYGSP